MLLAGGVPLFAVQLEHALQPRLANRADVRIAQVLSGDQAKGSVSLQSPRGQVRNALNAAVLQVSRQQHIGAPGLWRKDFHSQAELVGKHELLQPSICQQRFELVAHGRERQRVKAHQS